MPDTNAFRRPVYVALTLLLTSVVLLVVAVLHDQRVRVVTEALQAGEDRLEELQPRFAARAATASTPLDLAEDVALRRAVDEVCAALRGRLQEPELLRMRLDRWFAGKGEATVMVDLLGNVRAELRRARAEQRTSRALANAAGLIALGLTALACISLMRLLARLDQPLLPRSPAEAPPVRAAALPVPAAPPPPPKLPLPPRRVGLPPTPRPHARLPDTTPVPSGPLIPLHGRVLVIEDNPINQRVTMRQLGELQVSVEIVPDAETGLTRIAEGGWDVVLMDLQLPGIDGLTATRQWRQEEAKRLAATPGRRLPIIAITANALGTDRDACYAAGMDGYLAKPARLEDLHRALLRFIGPPLPKLGPTPTPATGSAPIIAPPITPMPSTPPPAAGDELPLHDPELWRKLRTETATADPRMLEELVSDLRLQAPGVLDLLTRALEGGDWERLRSVAHRLKGSAGMLGLPRLAAAAKAVEFAAKEQDVPASASGMSALRTALAATFTDPAVDELR